ncbi:MAG TPA: hypothetical protein VES67_22595 [Vicinamibacterales bacterium]|nr:hypothetical protein [Vicinamibacterales bacterium]
MRVPRAFVSLFLIAGVGCGGGGQSGSSSTPASSSQAASTAAPAAGAAATAQTPPGGQPSAQGGAGQMAQGLQQFAQGLSQLSQSQAKPVDFELLKGFLPELSGWTKEKARGEQMNMPFAISNAKAHYSSGESSMDIEITDSALNQMIFAPFAMFMASGYEERSDDGYKKAGTIAGSPGFESWEKDSSKAEVTVIVANRFVVQATGHRMASIDPVKKALETVDLAKLATLK